MKPSPSGSHALFHDRQIESRIAWQTAPSQQQ